MSLTANFTRGCVFMEATVATIQEANNFLTKVQACNGRTITTVGTYFAVVFPTDADADKFLQKIKPLITDIKNEHTKL